MNNQINLFIWKKKPRCFCLVFFSFKLRNVIHWIENPDSISSNKHCIFQIWNYIFEKHQSKLIRNSYKILQYLNVFQVNLKIQTNNCFTYEEERDWVRNDFGEVHREVLGWILGSWVNTIFVFKDDTSHLILLWYHDFIVHAKGDDSYTMMNTIWFLFELIRLVYIYMIKSL